MKARITMSKQFPVDVEVFATSSLEFYYFVRIFKQLAFGKQFHSTALDPSSVLITCNKLILRLTHSFTHSVDFDKIFTFAFDTSHSFQKFFTCLSSQLARKNLTTPAKV